MISNFEIENYRNLKYLKLDGLKRVNLITGKNNCGKSSLLEAVSIWAARGRFRRLIEIMFDRKELYQVKGRLSTIPILRSNGEHSNGYSNIENAVGQYSFLFNGRKIDFNERVGIKFKVNDEEIGIRFVKYKFDGRQKTEVVSDEEEFNLGCRMSYKTTAFERWLILSEDVVGLKRQPSYPTWLPVGENFQMVKPTGLLDSDSHILREQLSKITLTEKEDSLIETLRLVERDVERIGFSGDPNDNRVLLKIRGHASPVPLNSMGFGMARILAIASACINSDTGFLLIDEFENGLHWTIQRQLWETIFEISKKLKVQVFATTHSEDAIRAFAEAAESKGAGDAAFIRLNREGEEVTATHYEPSELLFATEHQIETRGL